MNGFLLDTNVLSELRKEKRCDRGVWHWFEQAEPAKLFISVLVVGEIRQGIERIRLRVPAQAFNKRVAVRVPQRVANDVRIRARVVDTASSNSDGR